MDNVLPISDIQEGMTHWTARITILEKLQPTQGLNSPTRYQKFVFLDEQGSRVQAILFNNEIEKMGSKIEVCKKYLISNAKVRQIHQRYQTDGLTMQWVISSRTVIQEVQANEDNIVLPFKYTNFNDFAHYMDENNAPIDILAVVIHALPVRIWKKDAEEFTLQKFVVINEEMQPVILTMWNAFVSKEGVQIVDNLHKLPVLICRRLKVGCYNGVALSTRIDSAILIDPPVLEARQLKNWAMRNQKKLADIVEENSYNKYNAQISVQPNQKFTLVANVLSTHKHAWVKTTLSFEYISQKYWYMACTKCFRSTDASYEYAFTCNSCGEKQIARPRCCLDVDLTDESGTITATAFGDLAEKLLTFNAMQVMQHSQQLRELPLDEVHKKFKSKMFTCQIKPSKSYISSGQKRFSLIYFCEEGNDNSPLQITLDDGPQTISQSSIPQITDTNSPGGETSSSKVRTSLAHKFDMPEEKDESGSNVDNPSHPKKAKLA